MGRPSSSPPMWRHKPLHCLLYLTYQAAGARAIAQLIGAMEKPASGRLPFLFHQPSQQVGLSLRP